MKPLLCVRRRHESAVFGLAEFIRSVNDNRLRALLDVSTNGAGAFRRFKDVLQGHPEERERWFAFHEERADRRVRRWLQSEGIEVATTPPGN